MIRITLNQYLSIKNISIKPTGFFAIKLDTILKQGDYIITIDERGIIESINPVTCNLLQKSAVNQKAKE